MNEKWLSPVLEASLSNPIDAVETTMITDAASVGTTLPLHGSNKKVKLTEEFLRANAGSFKGMPITLNIQEDGSLEKHSKTVIGQIKDAYFDEASKKVVTVGSLWKHYFPETIDQLMKLHKDHKAQVSWELEPSETQHVEGEDEDTIEPLAGRFVGQAVIGNGADLGNSIRLLAAAAEKEQKQLEEEAEKQPPVVGSFEWIADQVANYFTASSNVDDFEGKEVVGTYQDATIYEEDGKLFKLSYDIEGTNIKFSDTIEVEPTYQPLGASAAGSVENTPEAAPPTEEAGTSNMAEIDDKELEALRAAKADAETRVAELEAEKTTLTASVEEHEAFKAQVESDNAAAAQATLAASRLADVEKIIPYTDDKQKDEDLEAFKTMDDKSFDIVKRTLQAAAEVKGGVAPEATISNPFTSREDPDGAAASILNTPEYQALKAAYSAPQEGANA